MEKTINSTIDITLLEKAIAVFNNNSLKLQNSYSSLQEKISELNSELAQKNQALSHNLKEKELITLYLTNILESVNLGIIVFDYAGNVRMYNQETKKIVGNTSKINKKDLELMFNLKFNDILKKIKGNYSKEIEFIYNSNEKLYLSISVCSLCDNYKNRIGFIMTIEDITEKIKIKKEMEKNKQLMLMGEMVHKIAHEIRNPLGSILLFTTMLKRNLKESDTESLELVEHIANGVNSLNHVVNSYLSFTKKHEINCTLIDIKKVIEESLVYTLHLIKEKSVTIEKDFSNSNEKLIGDPEALKQVFINFFSNAFQAMEKTGKLIISVNNLTNGGITIKISDNGQGIKESEIQRIFEPFFTTKSKGTGLGLYISKKIIEAHHGTIEVKSEMNKGTEFIINIPFLNDNYNN